VNRSLGIAVRSTLPAKEGITRTGRGGDSYQEPVILSPGLDLTIRSWRLLTYKFRRKTLQSCQA